MVYKSIKSKKKKLIDNYKDKYEDKLKVVKISDDWYELDFC